MASIETEEYRRESKKPMAPEPKPINLPKKITRRRKAHHSYRTRASRTEQLEIEFEVLAFIEYFFLLIQIIFILRHSSIYQFFILCKFRMLILVQISKMKMILQLTNQLWILPHLQVKMMPVLNTQIGRQIMA